MESFDIDLGLTSMDVDLGLEQFVDLDLGLDVEQEPEPEPEPAKVDTDFDLNLDDVEEEPEHKSDPPLLQPGELEPVRPELPMHDLRPVPVVDPARLKENRANVVQSMPTEFKVPVRDNYQRLEIEFGHYKDDSVGADPTGLSALQNAMGVVVSKTHRTVHQSTSITLSWSFVDDVLMVFHRQSPASLPACTAGFECQGFIAARIPTGAKHLAAYADGRKFGGAPLVQAVTPAEWEEWRRAPRTTRLPPRVCIYCYWSCLPAMIIEAGYNEISRDTNLAFFIVPTDCDDGYKRDYCIGPNEKVHNGLHGFIPNIRFPFLAVDYRRDRWVLDHSLMRYDPALHCYPPATLKTAKAISDTRLSSITRDVVNPSPALDGSVVFSRPTAPNATEKNTESMNSMSDAAKSRVLGK